MAISFVRCSINLEFSNGHQKSLIVGDLFKLKSWSDPFILTLNRLLSSDVSEALLALQEVIANPCDTYFYPCVIHEMDRSEAAAVKFIPIHLIAERCRFQEVFDEVLLHFTLIRDLEWEHHVELMDEFGIQEANVVDFKSQSNEIILKIMLASFKFDYKSAILMLTLDAEHVTDRIISMYTLIQMTEGSLEGLNEFEVREILEKIFWTNARPHYQATQELGSVLRCADSDVHYEDVYDDEDNSSVVDEDVVYPRAASRHSMSLARLKHFINFKSIHFRHPFVYNMDNFVSDRKSDALKGMEELAISGGGGDLSNFYFDFYKVHLRETNEFWTFCPFFVVLDRCMFEDVREDFLKFFQEEFQKMMMQKDNEIEMITFDSDPIELLAKRILFNLKFEISRGFLQAIQGSITTEMMAHLNNCVEYASIAKAHLEEFVGSEEESLLLHTQLKSFHSYLESKKEEIGAIKDDGDYYDDDDGDASFYSTVEGEAEVEDINSRGAEDNFDELDESSTRLLSTIGSFMIPPSFIEGEPEDSNLFPLLGSLLSPIPDGSCLDGGLDDDISFCISSEEEEEEDGSVVQEPIAPIENHSEIEGGGEEEEEVISILMPIEEQIPFVAEHFLLGLPGGEAVEDEEGPLDREPSAEEEIRYEERENQDEKDQDHQEDNEDGDIDELPVHDDDQTQGEEDHTPVARLEDVIQDVEGGHLSAIDHEEENEEVAPPPGEVEAPAPPPEENEEVAPPSEKNEEEDPIHEEGHFEEHEDGSSHNGTDNDFEDAADEGTAAPSTIVEDPDIIADASVSIIQDEPINNSENEHKKKHKKKHRSHKMNIKHKHRKNKKKNESSSSSSGLAPKIEYFPLSHAALKVKKGNSIGGEVSNQFGRKKAAKKKKEVILGGNISGGGCGSTTSAIGGASSHKQKEEEEEEEVVLVVVVNDQLNDHTDTEDLPSKDKDVLLSSSSKENENSVINKSNSTKAPQGSAGTDIETKTENIITSTSTSTTYTTADVIFYINLGVLGVLIGGFSYMMYIHRAIITTM